MPRAKTSRLSSEGVTTRPSKTLETFPNPKPERDYEIDFACPEFTCVCPMTGQPDFATIRITYVPDLTCVELKSLKLYLWSYRDEGAFHEDVTNRILDDLQVPLDVPALANPVHDGGEPHRHVGSDRLGLLLPQRVRGCAFPIVHHRSLAPGTVGMRAAEAEPASA